jgi:hypothetical protein
MFKLLTDSLFVAICHSNWLCSRKYVIVWYHPTSSRFYLIFSSFVSFRENRLARFWISTPGPRVWSQLSACCVLGVRCWFYVNSFPCYMCVDGGLTTSGASAGCRCWPAVDSAKPCSSSPKPTGDLVPFSLRSVLPRFVKSKDRKQTTKVLYLTYRSNPMWSVDCIKIKHTWKNVWITST